MTDQSLAKKEAPKTAMERVKNYILSPEVKERFSDMMGSNGIFYLNQVMILVANSKDLQECEPKSILIAAMRAASLKLSVDIATGQAWIIARNSKDGKQATFQLGYKGIYELAMRTNQYRRINVFDLYQGEELIEDRITGDYTLAGARTGDTVVARALYFELINGFSKTFVMTCQEIEEHAKRYAPQSWNNTKSSWHTERAKMERKTVLANGLRKWGRFNPADAETVEAIEENKEFIEPGELPAEGSVTPPVVEHHTEAENMNALGFGDF